MASEKIQQAAFLMHQVKERQKEWESTNIHNQYHKCRKEILLGIDDYLNSINIKLQSSLDDAAIDDCLSSLDALNFNISYICYMSGVMGISDALSKLGSSEIEFKKQTEQDIKSLTSVFSTYIEKNPAIADKSIESKMKSLALMFSLNANKGMGDYL
jgi:hypothetical protein